MRGKKEKKRCKIHEKPITGLGYLKASPLQARAGMNSRSNSKGEKNEEKRKKKKVEKRSEKKQWYKKTINAAIATTTTAAAYERHRKKSMATASAKIIPIPLRPIKLQRRKIALHPLMDAQQAPSLMITSKNCSRLHAYDFGECQNPCGFGKKDAQASASGVSAIALLRGPRAPDRAGMGPIDSRRVAVPLNTRILPRALLVRWPFSTRS